MNLSSTLVSNISINQIFMKTHFKKINTINLAYL